MKISNRDWVQLSCYLDGELNSREKKSIEERLSKDAVLQLALEELRQAKTILRHTPTLKVPRNFMLTPAMAGLTTRPRPARGYRLASALMTFLLVGVLVLDFGRSFINGGFAPAAPKEVMLEAVSESAADAIEEPALMEAEGALDSDRAVEEAETEANLEEEPAPALAAEAAEVGESTGLPGEAQTKSADAEATDTAASQTDEWQEDQVVEELALPSRTSTPEISGTPVPQPQTFNYVPEETAQGTDKVTSIDPFSILEIILGCGALAFGVAAWMVRRRKS